MFQFRFRKRRPTPTEPLLVQLAHSSREGEVLTLMGQLHDHFVTHKNSVAVVWFHPVTSGAQLSVYTSLNWKETDVWPTELAMQLWQRGGMITKTDARKSTLHCVCIGPAGSSNGVMLVRIMG